MLTRLYYASLLPIFIYSFYLFIYFFFLALFMQVDDKTMIFFLALLFVVCKNSTNRLFFSLFMQYGGGNKKLYLLFKRERFSPTGNECAGYYLVIFFFGWYLYIYINIS